MVCVWVSEGEGQVQHGLEATKLRVQLKWQENKSLTRQKYAPRKGIRLKPLIDCSTRELLFLYTVLGFTCAEDTYKTIPTCETGHGDHSSHKPTQVLVRSLHLELPLRLSRFNESSLCHDKVHRWVHVLYTTLCLGE